MPRAPFRFALPPSTGLDGLGAPAAALRAYLTDKLGRDADVTVSQTYEVLTRNLLSGAIDAAWAPPFVCAKTEPEGVRVLLQSVRRGRASYASALVGRRADGLSLASLRGRTVAWVDPYSVAGYLLPMAYLRKRGMPPESVFTKQGFAGSYGEALRAVVDGIADVACVHCTGEGGAAVLRESLTAHYPPAADELALIDITEEVPSDGVVVRDGATRDAERLEAAFAELSRAKDGPLILREVFRAEGFAKAKVGGYRALYFIAPR